MPQITINTVFISILGEERSNILVVKLRRKIYGYSWSRGVQGLKIIYISNLSNPTKFRNECIQMSMFQKLAFKSSCLTIHSESKSQRSV